MVLKYQYPFDLSHYDSDDGYNAPRSGSSNHRGADFNGLPQGTPIPAVAAGTVVENYRSGGLGWLVVLAHPDNRFSGYCHLYQQSPLAIGSSVTRGQVVGGIGETGQYANGVHLHLTIGLNQSGATGGGSHWIDHTDPITYIGDRLNGDDPITALPKPKEDDMIRLARIPINGANDSAGVHWIVIDHGARAYWNVKSMPAVDLLRAQGIIEIPDLQAPSIVGTYRNITNLT